MTGLTRTLKLGSYGLDVQACKRAVHRYLQTGELAKLEARPDTVARTFGPWFQQLVGLAQQKAKLPPDGVIGPALERVLRKEGAFDAYADELLEQHAASLTPFCYPHPLGSRSTIGQGLHVTAGLPGNWAIDFMAAGGTPVVCVEKAQVVKVSGHSPDHVVDVSVGIFGWNVHYQTPAGYRWFSTHYGSVRARVGQHLNVGDVVGTVGSWPHDPGRSHTHLGVTSPRGWTDAQRRIETVARSPRVTLT